MTSLLTMIGGGGGNEEKPTRNHDKERDTDVGNDNNETKFGLLGTETNHSFGQCFTWALKRGSKVPQSQPWNHKKTSPQSTEDPRLMLWTRALSCDHWSLPEGRRKVKLGHPTRQLNWYLEKSVANMTCLLLLLLKRGRDTLKNLTCFVIAIISTESQHCDDLPCCLTSTDTHQQRLRLLFREL